MPVRKRPLITGGQQYYSQSGVARHLGVPRAAVGNWLSRYDDYPPPAAHVDEQVPLWAPEQLEGWTEWFEWRTSPAQRARWLKGVIQPEHQ